MDAGGIKSGGESTFTFHLDDGEYETRGRCWDGWTNCHMYLSWVIKQHVMTVLIGIWKFVLWCELVLGKYG